MPSVRYLGAEILCMLSWEFVPIECGVAYFQ